MLTQLLLRVIDKNSADLTIGRNRYTLQKGKWSPIIEVEFKVGLIGTVKSLTRIIWSRRGKEITLFALPLQIHPLHSLWPYATPRQFVKQIWRQHGAWLTVGWPQDTTALEEGYINEEQFDTLCQSIWQQREKILLHQLGHFREGVLGCVFDTLDRIQHMFLRDRPDFVHAWYERMDGTIKQVLERLPLDTRLLVVSDHGFTTFDQKVDLNRWLINNQFMQVSEKSAEMLSSSVDWSHSTAYAVGLNSLCLNLKGREKNGIIDPTKRDHILDQLSTQLADWRDSTGKQIVKQVHRLTLRPDMLHMPDAIIGYHADFRASSATALGGWSKHELVANTDKWGADHCVDASVVPGVLFSNQSLSDFPRPSFKDIPHLAIQATLDDTSGPPTSKPNTSEPRQDEQILRERLKSLGYLS